MRIIPSNTNVETQLYKGVSLTDAVVALCGILIAGLAFLSNIPHRFIVAGLFIVLTAISMCNMDSEKTYMLIYNSLKYVMRPKVFIKKGISNNYRMRPIGRQTSRTKKEEAKYQDITYLTPFTGIDDNMIEYADEYYATVIEIPSMEFKFLTENKQNFLVDKVIGSIIRTISSNQMASFVKIDRPVIYDKFKDAENKKILDLQKAFENKLINETELQERTKVIHARLEEIERLNTKERVVRPFHYLVLYEGDVNLLEEMTSNAIKLLRENEMDVRRLNNEELAIFLKYNFSYDFDERDVKNVAPEQYVDWILPDKIEFSSRMVKFDEKLFYNLRISSFPNLVTNAWGCNLFNIPNTKVVMKIRSVEKSRAIRAIDRSIDELRSRQASTSKTSKLIDLNVQANTLAELLSLLNGDSEVLYDVNIYVTIFDNIQTNELLMLEQMKKEEAQNPTSQVIDPKTKKPIQKYKNANRGVSASAKNAARKYVKRILNENDFKTSDLFLQQFEGFASGQISKYDSLKKRGQKMPSGSAAAVFPFVYPGWLDPKGFKLGHKDGVPVFLDFFARDSSRINSNMVIIGKSGSGKSFSTKTILVNLAAEDTKIFILDPENEYKGIAKKMHGKLIDVGSNAQGIINPFHIITTLSDDETEETNETNSTERDENKTGTSFSMHLQFLEEFFKQILPDIDVDAREYLNNLIIRMYEEKGINAEAELSKLTPSDFPTFDDLYEKVLSDFQTTTGEYSKKNLRILLNYVSKFATGGRNSNLWNGESSISTKENFIVFNFQSLLANKNGLIANAQMLLVLKWLDNEIIKNRDYNLKYHANRKIIVVIDEAHVFIDEKFPIALDFMFQLAKRIRKYSGMQIIITQNVRDFVGTEEIARKSTAIINACQYSLIFPLAPNDMNDLVKLYEKAGSINEIEQEEIINNGRGNAFVILTPSNRTSISIVAPEEIQGLF